jgi:hypothetical protein
MRSSIDGTGRIALMRSRPQSSRWRVGTHLLPVGGVALLTASCQPAGVLDPRGPIGSALAFGVLIVFLVIDGSIWIVANLNANLMSMPMN